MLDGQEQRGEGAVRVTDDMNSAKLQLLDSAARSLASVAAE